MGTSKEKILGYLGENQYCVLCTGAGDDVRATPVRYSTDGMNIVIYSEKFTRKFAYLKKNPHVALALHSASHPLKGLQIWGAAEVVTAGDSRHADYLFAEAKKSEKLREACIRVQLDTSDERPGAKFYKWEMKGVPIRLEVGPRDIQKGVVTMARRDGVKKAVPVESLVEFLFGEAGDLQAALYSKAEQFRDSKVKGVTSIEEAKAQTERGVALVPWCGSEECGHQLEDKVGANMLGEPQYVSFAAAPCVVCGKVSGKRTYMARQY